MERQFLKATSIDYTVCEIETDRPLLSVEFDGLGHGYSQGTRYRQFTEASIDPYRAEKLTTKLRLAEEASYSLFVVSYDEAGAVDGEDELNITHAIIGESLVNSKAQAAIETRIRESRVEELPEESRTEALREIVTDVEVELEFEWNPFVRATSRLMGEALDHGMTSWEQTQLIDPPFPDVTEIADLTEAVMIKGAHLFRASRHGCRVTAEHPEGSVTREAWVRNIMGPGVFAWPIATNLAKLLAFRALLRELPKGLGSRESFKKVTRGDALLVDLTD